MVDELKLSGNELNVYALLFNFTNNTPKKCFYGSQEYIGERIGASRRTVVNCIRSLREKGYIAKKSIEHEDKTYEGYMCRNFPQVSKNFSTPEKKLHAAVSKNFSEGYEKISHKNKDNKENIKYKDRFISVETFIQEV